MVIGRGVQAQLVPRTVRVPGFVLRLGVHAGNSRLPRHTHEDPTICYVLAGRFSEYSRGQVADCEGETLKVTPAGEVHWNRFGDAQTFGLRIDVDRRRFQDSPAIFRALDERFCRRGSAAGELARRLATEIAFADDVGHVAAEGLALELVAELARGPSLRATRRNAPWIIRADEMIRNLYSRRFSLAEVAAEIGVQPATLARGYRKTFGCTLGERVRRLRVEHAARALAESDAPLSHVALSAGFYDQSHLTNVFRRYTGETPAAYRSRCG
jgi:AraC family transcriptional regulator